MVGVFAAAGAKFRHDNFIRGINLVFLSNVVL